MKKSSPRILVVEDAPPTQMILKSALNEYSLTIVGSLVEAKAEMSKGRFDLYIFDIMLPDGESFELCRQLRSQIETKDKPVLFLSGKTAELDRLKAFDEGADDYVTKPFSPLELRARIAAKFKHLKPEESARVAMFGAFVIDFDRRRVSISESATGISGSIGQLTKIEFDLLAVLVERPEVVRSRQFLLERVWGDQVAVTDRSVDVHIYNLRKKLGPFSDCVQSHHGQGYSFIPSRLPHSVAS